MEKDIENEVVKDTFSYKGWLISDRFYKRVLANVGYHFVGLIFFYIAFLGLIIFSAAVVGIFSFFRLFIG